MNILTFHLSNRHQYVPCIGYSSGKYKVTSGVPQGYKLGPVLCLIFLNDICNLFDCSQLLFADDLQIYTSYRRKRNIIIGAYVLDNRNNYIDINYCYRFGSNF